MKYQNANPVGLDRKTIFCLILNRNERPTCLNRSLKYIIIFSIYVKRVNLSALAIFQE